MRVACIVPGYNEEARIAAVLETVRSSSLVDEVIAVSDGSTDGTCGAAQSVSGVRVYRLPENAGKGAAMRAGAGLTDAPILLFLDADLIGLRRGHVDLLLVPILEDQADMTVGKFRGGRFLTDLAQAISPNISGQRAIRRDLFLEVPRLQCSRMDVEVRINRWARRHGWRIGVVPLVGVTHPMKEEKLGLLRGVCARYRMYREIVTAILFGRGEEEMKPLIVCSVSSAQTPVQEPASASSSDS